ncbi:MAG: NAD(P)-dependent oxidoreductase [Planctomycetes bacterium]|nr:NAD(P)-dependent oxidoreductase [Planctomycetota bacterium]
MKKVLVTGATGRIGTIVAEDLARKYELTLLGRRRINRPGFLQIDVASEYPRLAQLVTLHDAVLHLAYIEEDGFTCDNIRMIRNVYRAALDAPSRPRVIAASSLHVVGGYVDWNAAPYSELARRDAAPPPQMPPLITIDRPLFPNGLYGALKAYIETLGRYYASRGLKVVVIRFGGVRPDDSRPNEPGYHTFWLSRRDCAHVIDRALDATIEQDFSVVFAVSDNSRRIHDIEPARSILGYRPLDNSELSPQQRP